MLDLRLAFALLCGGCVGTNPNWDGATDAVSMSAGIEGSSASGDSQDDASGTSDGATAGVACANDPAGVGECPPQCENDCAEGVCALGCMGEMACKDATVACPDGWPCRVVCDGKQACKSTEVVCPSEHACRIECIGEQACEEASVQCGGAACHLSCMGDKQTCDQSTFACGAADSFVECDTAHDAPPTLTPAGASSCACESAGC